ncbi:MAG: peptidylprolyl isomerase [Breznakibacter sp.]
MYRKLFLFTGLILTWVWAAQAQSNPKVLIRTSLGDITVMLYNETPQHRDNFLKLVREHYYDSLLFHRVIQNFMIQAGDPDSRTAQPDAQLGNGGPSYTLPAEIAYPVRFHKKGALAAARLGDQMNPERRSSGSQFYIVQGEVIPAERMPLLEQNLTQKHKQAAGYRTIAQFSDSLNHYAQVRDSVKWVNLRNKAVTEAEKAAAGQPPVVIPEPIREVYQSLGGTPHLDGEYTVFGEVVSGLEVIDKIAALPTDANNRPAQDVKMWMEVVPEPSNR